MKKLAIAFVTAVSVLCLSALAFAGSLAPGASVTCNDAKSIKIESAGTHAGDRANANLVIWKSSNFTTVPFTLAPKDHQGFSTNGGGAAGNKQVKMSSKHEMGHKSVTFKSQNNFSRGDSIGDISGEVRIHNTGTVPVSVTCG